MRNFIPLLASLCLLFSCTGKEDTRLPRSSSRIASSAINNNCDIQGIYSTWYIDNDNYGYYKGYANWGEPDTLSINLYGYINIRGKIHRGPNVLAILASATGDTVFSAILNSQQQPILVRHTPDNMYDLWATFSYDSAGRLTQITGDTIFNNDYRLSYDSLGNLIRIAEARHPDRYMAFTYDYSTPITGGDYPFDTYYQVLGDLKICNALNLVDIRPHHKLTHITSYIFPTFDRDYHNQFIDAQGKLIYYETEGFSYTLNWYCL